MFGPGGGGGTFRGGMRQRTGVTAGGRLQTTLKLGGLAVRRGVSKPGLFEYYRHVMSLRPCVALGLFT